MVRVVICLSVRRLYSENWPYLGNGERFGHGYY